MNKQDGVTFKATITVKPEVTVENYKGIEVEKEIKKIMAKEVNAEIEKVREQNARTLSVEDRAAKKGDIANIDFEGFVNNKPFEGGKANDHTLTLGDGQFIKGFEEQIIGHKPGEEFDVNVTFPENYTDELKGKDATFKCKLNNLKVKELPELDDEFAKDVSEFDTLKEYKADIKSKLQEQANKEAEKATETNIGKKLAELIKADIPEAMFSNEIKHNFNDFAYNLKSQGMDAVSYTHLTLPTNREV
eukprot:TRINITY_DN4558_c0_g2_i9.p1 TRINITY_DN4558_c0_g2~~TRINITY_DN4558_c0_g2_i9.p1  ORF type:complete len:247 (-),score=22.13 TRINITY_DN4558_c0_g2_i9:64-804(-)